MSKGQSIKSEQANRQKKTKATTCETNERQLHLSNTVATKAKKEKMHEHRKPEPAHSHTVWMWMRKRKQSAHGKMTFSK